MSRVLPEDPSARYASYLDSKKSVDDRALNRVVLASLARELEKRDSINVLELGAGIGTMVARLIDWSIIRRAHYTLLDADRHSLTEAAQWLSEWARRSGLTATEHNGVLRVAGGANDVDVTVTFAHATLDQYLAREASALAQHFELLIANAFLDLVDIPAVLPVLLKLLAADGLFWFSINFDGETIFTPEHPADSRLLDVYHSSMNGRVRDGKVCGDSRTGRRLFEHIRTAGAHVLAAGSSDWVVHALDQTYPEREGEFIEHILATIEAELNWRKEVDQQVLSEWLRIRRQQLANGELVYIAHQLDFLGRP